MGGIRQLGIPARTPFGREGKSSPFKQISKFPNSPCVFIEIAALFLPFLTSRSNFVSRIRAPAGYGSRLEIEPNQACLLTFLPPGPRAAGGEARLSLAYILAYRKSGGVSSSSADVIPARRPPGSAERPLATRLWPFSQPALRPRGSHNEEARNGRTSVPPKDAPPPCLQPPSPFGRGRGAGVSGLPANGEVKTPPFPTRDSGAVGVEAPTFMPARRMPT